MPRFCHELKLTGLIEPGIGEFRTPGFAGFHSPRLPSARFQIPTSSHRRTAAERGNGLGKVERKSTAVNVAVHGGEPRNHAANESIGTPVTSVSLGSNPTVTAKSKAPTPLENTGKSGPSSYREERLR